MENIRILIKKEKERALKDSTKSSVEDKRYNIPSWKLRTMVNLGWMTEERALQSIMNFKSLMLTNLDVEPTEVQDKHFSIIKPTVIAYFEDLCGILESCSDAIADYLLETRRTQPTSVIVYDQAVAITIQLLDKLQTGITINEYFSITTNLLTLAKRIKAKLIEKRDYLTDRLSWRGISIESFNI